VEGHHVGRKAYGSNGVEKVVRFRAAQPSDFILKNSLPLPKSDRMAGTSRPGAALVDETARKAGRAGKTRLVATAIVMRDVTYRHRLLSREF
jgi:hypothetical protein